MALNLATKADKVCVQYVTKTDLLLFVLHVFLLCVCDLFVV